MCNFLKLVGLTLHTTPVALLVKSPSGKAWMLSYGGFSQADLARLRRSQPHLPCFLNQGNLSLYALHLPPGANAGKAIGLAVAVHLSQLGLGLRLFLPGYDPDGVGPVQVSILQQLSHQLELYLALAPPPQISPLQAPKSPLARAQLAITSPYLQPILHRPQALPGVQREALSGFMTALQSCLSYRQLGDLLRHQMPLFFPQMAGRFFLLAAAAQSPLMLSSWGDLPADSQFSLTSPSHCCTLGTSLPSQVCAGSCAVCHGCEQPLSNQGYRSYCFMVLNLRQPEGLLQLIQPLNGAINPQILDLVGQLANQISPVLERLRLLEDLHNQALRDPLTGLLNRRYMEKVLSDVLQQTQNTDYQVSIILVDIDHFKRVNDTYGHPAGDAVLKTVAMVLRGHVRPSDMVCRYGGEEFCIVLLDTPIAVAQSRAEKMRQAVKYLTPSYHGQALKPVTMSLGIATFPAQGISAESLIDQADKALYWAKNHGRNQVARADQLTSLAPSEEAEAPISRGPNPV